MSKEIILAAGQTGYEAVGKYVFNYWHENCFTTVIVSLATSYDGKDYRKHNEVISPRNDGNGEFLHDWWEGEKYIKIFGIIDVDDIEIAPADVAPVVRCKDCKYFEADEFTSFGICKCRNGVNYSAEIITHKDHYCSYGERREENEG